MLTHCLLLLKDSENSVGVMSMAMMNLSSGVKMMVIPCK